MKVCVLGASGFIGRHLTQALTARGDEATAASLRDPERAAATAAQCDAVVNLAGESIAQRWTSAVKHAILFSRTELPRRFLEALASIEPRHSSVYISASAIGYYGTSESETFVEENPPGANFLAQVCEAWERQARAARDFGLRVAMIRTGIVLDARGGALAKMLPAFRLGLGGIVGSGRQSYSWIHIDDLVGIYASILQEGDGAFNAVAPHPVTNAEFTRALGAALGRPTALPTPLFALQLVLGEGASLLTEGQRVVPSRIVTERNYLFQYPEIGGALANLLPTSS